MSDGQGFVLRTTPKLERVKPFLARDFNDVTLPYPLAGHEEIMELLNRRVDRLESFRERTRVCTALCHPFRYRAIVRRMEAHADVARYVDVHEKGAHQYRIFSRLDGQFPLSHYPVPPLAEPRTDYVMGPDFRRNENPAYGAAQALAREEAARSAAYWEGRRGKHGLEAAPDAEAVEDYGDSAGDFLEGRNQAKWVRLLAFSARRRMQDPVRD